MDATLDEAPCGFLAFDDDSIVVQANRTLCQWLGYASMDIVGQPLKQLLPPGGAIFHQTHFFPLLKLHDHADEVYLSLRAADGGTLPMLVSARRRRVGTQVSNDCVLLPMRQRHRFEDGLVRARRAAEAARDTKAHFLSMLAHEVRSPVAAITALADVLHSGMHGPLTPDQQEDAGLIASAGHDIDHLVDGVMRYARAEAGIDVFQPETVRVDPAFDSVESIMRPRWQETGITYIRRGDRGCAANADPSRLHQILLNLLTNAAKFIPAGGEVSMQCHSDADTGMLRIEVRDSGPGIADADLERIFEPFVQIAGAARTGGKGFGLGLAISRELATAMHGSLQAASIPDQGACFVLQLPAAGEPASE